MLVVMAYDGRAIANFILDRCEERGRRVTNLALQKITFFSHAWHLIQFDEPLIKHKFEAWQHGPVLQYLYRDFNHFGSLPIHDRAKRLDQTTGRQIVVTYDFDQKKLDFLLEVVDFYSRIPASKLVDLSHAPGGPWERAWNHDGRVNPGMKIENDAIRAFYSTVSPPFLRQ